MTRIQSPSQWEMAGGPQGTLVSFGSLVSRVTVVAKAACILRCQPRKSADPAAIAPVATPILAAGNLEPGWVSMAANDVQTFGPEREEGQVGRGELEIWELAAGKLVIEVG